MTLVHGAVPDVRRALGEVHRALRPGGRLLILDFVRSRCGPVWIAQRLLDSRLVSRYGFHLLRDPLDHLSDVGFTVEQVERTKWGLVERLVTRKPLPSEIGCRLAKRQQPGEADDPRAPSAR